MSWFDRSLEFSNRRIRKNAESRESTLPSGCALPVISEDCLTDHLTNPILGTSERAGERRERELSVTFHEGIAGQEYGARVIRKETIQAVTRVLSWKWSEMSLSDP